MTLESKTYGHWSNIPETLRRYQEIEGHKVMIKARKEQGYTVITDREVWNKIDDKQTELGGEAT